MEKQEPLPFTKQLQKEYPAIDEHAKATAGQPERAAIELQEGLKLQSLSISGIAEAIYADARVNKKNIPYGAKPYLDAMLDLDNLDQNYGLDSAQSIVLYFLTNFYSYRGPLGKPVRKELKRRLNEHGYKI